MRSSSRRRLCDCSCREGAAALPQSTSPLASGAAEATAASFASGSSKKQGGASQSSDCHGREAKRLRPPKRGGMQANEACRVGKQPKERLISFQKAFSAILRARLSGSLRSATAPLEACAVRAESRRSSQATRRSARASCRRVPAGKTNSPRFIPGM